MDAGMTAWRMSRASSKVSKAAAGLIDDQRLLPQKLFDAVTGSTPTHYRHKRMDEALDAAVADGIRLAGDLEQGITVPSAKNWIQQLFGRTADTKAHMEADALWKSATQLFRGVDNAADAKLLLQTWIDNPAELIRGVAGITSRQLREVAGIADDKVRYGFLSVAGDEQLQAIPILQAIKPKLLG
jgi:hypothetical protein